MYLELLSICFSSLKADAKEKLKDFGFQILDLNSLVEP
jgi:hypothetical protein